MTTQKKLISVLMGIITGGAIIGYTVEAGATLISTIASLFKPAVAKNLYMNFDMFDVQQKNTPLFLVLMALITAIPILKVIIWVKVAVLLKDFKVENPFKEEYTKVFQKIIIFLFIITALVTQVSVMFGYYATHYKLPKLGYDISDYFFTTMLLFIVVHVLKKGQELQEENDLTV